MNRLAILGIAVVVALYLLLSSIFIVDEREQAIVTRFGQIVDVKTEPGLYFKIPTDFVDAVQRIDGRIIRYDLNDLTVQVSGGAFYEVDAFLTYRVVDARLFRQRALGSLQNAETRIGTSFNNALRQVYGRRSFNAALSEQRTEMMAEARDIVRPDALSIGMEIVDVRILRTDLSEQVLERTYERMRAERLAEAAGLRARGQEAAQSLRAIADREQVGILAAARRDSEILRGEGDGERNRIFAAAFQQDPEFFEFYRSLQSYRTALGNNSTTMVLTPDSEFFRYFDQTGEGSVPATPAAAGAVPAPVDPAVPAVEPAAPDAEPVAPAEPVEADPAASAQPAPANQ